MSKLRDGLILLGGFFGSYFLCKRLSASREKPSASSGTFYVPGNPSPRPPMLMTGDSFRLVTGGKYYATVDVGFPTSLGASPEKILKLAAEKGFTHVSVNETRPSNWPGQAEADYYIYAEYSGQPMLFERNPGPGVNVVEAFSQ